MKIRRLIFKMSFNFSVNRLIIDLVDLVDWLIDQVMKKIREISAEGDTSLQREHQNHKEFKREHDEQILMWMNRLVESLLSTQ